MSAPLPREPRRGDPLDADWGRAVVRALRSQRLRGGPGVRVSTGPDGTTVSVDNGGRPANAPATTVPQWRISVETIPAEEEGGGPTYRVRCAGGSVVVTDLAVATAVSVGDESASSADGTDDSQGGGGHSHGDGHAHDAGGGGPSNESITVPGITYGV